MNDQPDPALTVAVPRVVRPIYGATLFGTLVWIGAIFLAPYLKSQSSEAAASFLYTLFSPICHQIPSRSFFFHGFPLAVCGRCLGIYVGFLAGLAGYPFVRGFSRLALPRVRVLALLSLPIGLNFVGGFLGLWTSSNGFRFATGVLWGTLLPFYFIPGVSELLLRRAEKRQKSRSRPSDQAIKNPSPRPRTGFGGS